MNGMSYAEGPDGDYEKKQQKRQEAMKARLEKLTKNPVVDTSIKKIDQQMNKPDREQWQVVDDLVSSAYGQFCDGDLTFKTAVQSLSQSLSELSKGQKRS